VRVSDGASIAAEAHKLFGEWAAEGEAGYGGEVSWEEFKREKLLASEDSRGQRVDARPEGEKNLCPSTRYS
jgi:hypothetical protein